MKKITVIQASFIAIGSLLAGLLIGASISEGAPSRKFLVGTFGTVDKYRKANMTEKDVILRNEYASDTARTAYTLKYYSYMYYKSLKTSLDIEKVIEKTASEEEFKNTSYTAVNALSEYKTYLDSARVDLMTIIHALESLGNNENIVLAGYFHNANNAITGIRYRDGILIEYLSSVETYLSSHPDKPHQGLKDAYDLLTINVMIAAMLSKDKPMLNYLKDKKFYNNNQGMKALLADVELKPVMNSMVAVDTAEMREFTGIDIKKVISQMNTFDETLSGELIVTQCLQADQGNLKNASDKKSGPDIASIINNKANAINQFDVMQAMLQNALMDACTPFCVGG
jgi:hypothetical protein